MITFGMCFNVFHIPLDVEYGRKKSEKLRMTPKDLGRWNRAAIYQEVEQAGIGAGEPQAQISVCHIRAAY